MSRELRLKFRKLEAGTLKAFHKGFSVLLALFVFTLLAIFLLHILYGSYATGLMVIPAVAVIAEALLMGLDFLFEWLAGDTTYEQAGVEPPEGTAAVKTEDSSVMDEARMVAASIKASRSVKKNRKNKKS